MDENYFKDSQNQNDATNDQKIKDSKVNNLFRKILIKAYKLIN